MHDVPSQAAKAPAGLPRITCPLQRPSWTFSDGQCSCSDMREFLEEALQYRHETQSIDDDYDDDDDADDDADDDDDDDFAAAADAAAAVVAAADIDRH